MLTFSGALQYREPFTIYHLGTSQSDIIAAVLVACFSEQTYSYSGASILGAAGPAQSIYG